MPPELVRWHFGVGLEIQSDARDLGDDALDIRAYRAPCGIIGVADRCARGAIFDDRRLGAQGCQLPGPDRDGCERGGLLCVSRGMARLEDQRE